MPMQLPGEPAYGSISTMTTEACQVHILPALPNDANLCCSGHSADGLTRLVI